MIKPDVIVSWPRNCDYPLWRQFIHDNRDRFSKVIVAFTGAPVDGDYDCFVRESTETDGVTCITVPHEIPGDWRNNAVHRALTYSLSEWVWFTEQDLNVNDEFFNDVERAVNAGADVFAVYQGSRMHPCSILIKRSVLYQLRLDFGIIPDVADHFVKIQQQLEAGEYTIFRANPKTYKHLNGLSHNWYLLTHGGQPNYQVGEFGAWLGECLKCTVPIDETFKKWAMMGLPQG